MKFKKSYRRVIVIVAVLILGLLILAALARRGGALVEKWLLIKSRPGVTLSAEAPLQADVLFNHQPGEEVFSERIISEINKAHSSLEIAMYAFTSAAIKEAVFEADRRGVKVTIITDFRKQETHDAFFADAPKSITRLHVGAETSGRTILMHHKFAIIDRGTEQQTLLFGAYNWTDLQEKYDPSFLMVSADAALVDSFGREFVRLQDGQSGPQKLLSEDYYPWDLQYQAGNYSTEVWFSPGKAGDGIENRMSSLVNSAQNELQIMIWDFTDKDLAVDLIRRARDGVKVTVITDTWNFYNKNSVFMYLLEAKERYRLDNFELITDEVGGEKALMQLNEAELDEGFDPFLHFHVMIADGDKVLFGTNNWSRAGGFYNDESIVVSAEPKIVNAFKDAFNYQHQQNTIQPSEVIVD